MRPQPKPGDVLLGCVHRPNIAEGSHVFGLDAPIEFKRPGGTTGTANWIILCGACFVKYGHEAYNAPIGCDMTWREDDEPIVYKKPS